MLVGRKFAISLVKPSLVVKIHCLDMNEDSEYEQKSVLVSEERKEGFIPLLPLSAMRPPYHHHRETSSPAAYYEGNTRGTYVHFPTFLCHSAFLLLFPSAQKGPWDYISITYGKLSKTY